MEINRNVIKDHRTDRSWSQQHLADACDISLRTIQRVENLGVASTETVMALAAVLGVDQTSLLPQSENERSRFLPKSDVGLMLLILSMTFIGALIGAFLTFWVSR